MEEKNFDIMEKHPEIIKQKKVVIPWSGGFDSTSLIIDVLENHPEYDIELAWFKLSNNPDQYIAESFARRNIHSLLTKMYPDRIIYLNDVGSTIEINPLRGNSGIVQPQIWLTLLSLQIDQGATDKVAFAWVKHDDVWHYRNNVIRLWNHLLSFKDNTKTPTCELWFPYEWHTKEMMVDIIWKEKHHEIFKMLSTSEYGYHWQLEGLHDYQMNEGKNEEIRKLYKLYLKKFVELKSRTQSKVEV